jgi:metal-responsive CopG/Arc/MetJ family transcriptional regulator
MRVHITLDDELVAELDRRLGSRERSGFIARAVAAALDDERRWELIEGSLGAIADEKHPWDRDPAGWVRDQRRADARRVG